jgi:acyl dehydratase
MLDRGLIGLRLPQATTAIEAGRIRRFAEAIDERGALYNDEQAARAAGYRSLIAPPTFVTTIRLDAYPAGDLYALAGLDLPRVLHGEQEFNYGVPVCAGDTLLLESEIVDVYEKSGGALEFLVVATTGRNQFDELAFESRSTLVLRRLPERTT